jgi:hypothetical protein
VKTQISTMNTYNIQNENELLQRHFVAEGSIDDLLAVVDEALQGDPDLKGLHLERQDCFLKSDGFCRSSIFGQNLHGSIILTSERNPRRYLMRLECNTLDSAYAEKLINWINRNVPGFLVEGQLDYPISIGGLFNCFRTIENSPNSYIDFTSSAFESARRCVFDDIAAATLETVSYFTPENMRNGKFRSSNQRGGKATKVKTASHNGMEIPLPFQLTIMGRDPKRALRLLFNVDNTTGRFIVGDAHDCYLTC